MRKIRLSILLALSLVALLSGCATMKGAITQAEEQPRPVLGKNLFEFCNTEYALQFQENFYENMPVSASVLIDRDGSSAVETEDAEQIAALFEAMKDITVSRETNQFVTDAYHSVYFNMADGSSFGFRFDGKWLDYAGKNYVLKNDANFWKLCNSIVTEKSNRE